MSTKIFNGYILPHLSLGELHEFLLRFRSLISDKAQEGIDRLHASISTDIIDSLAIDGYSIASGEAKQYHMIEGKVVPLTAAYCNVASRQREVEKTGLRDPAYDYSCSLSFCPADGGILALLFTEQNEFEEAWESMDEVTPFGYWDNTDEPNDITQEEWENRRRIWDKALGETGVPAHRFFEFDCIGKSSISPSKASELVKYVPSRDDRINRVVRNIAVEDSLGDAVTKSISNLMRAMNEVAAWMKTEEGREWHSAEYNRVDNLLPVIDKEKLITPIEVEIT